MKLNEIRSNILTKKNEVKEIEVKIKAINNEIINHKPSKAYYISIWILIPLVFFFPLLFIPIFIIGFVGLKKESTYKKMMKSSENTIKELELTKENAYDSIQDLEREYKLTVKRLRFQTYVAGTSYRQKEIEKFVKKCINSEGIKVSSNYLTTKREMIEIGLEGYKFWEYDPIGIEVVILPEKDNEFDKNALAVHVKEEKFNNVKLGYIPKKDINKVTSLDIKQAVAFIKGGRYRELDIIDYDPINNKSTYKVSKGVNNYSIDLTILLK